MQWNKWYMYHFRYKRTDHCRWLGSSNLDTDSGIGYGEFGILGDNADCRQSRRNSGDSYGKPFSVRSKRK